MVSRLPDAALLGGLQLMLYGCCWGLAVLLLAEQRRASMHWGLYSILAGASVWVIGHPLALSHAGWMSAGLILSLVGYAAAVRGVDVFLHGQARNDHLTWGLTGLACAMLLVLGLRDAPVPEHLVVFSVARTTLLVGSVLLFVRELRRQFGLLGTLVAAVPPLLFGLVSLPTLVSLVTTADTLQRLQSGQAQPVERVAVMLTAAALFNFSFLYLLVGRLFTRLRHLAQHDALTGLLNRRAMDQALDYHWQQHRRLGHGLALAVLDIDHFKRINDTHGHAVGDQVLVALTQALTSSARAADILARMGGEEFLLLMPATDTPGAHRAVERLREAVDALRIAVPGGEVTFTLSAGLAVANTSDTDVVTVLRRADRGVYRAKREGRNRVVADDGPTPAG